MCKVMLVEQVTLPSFGYKDFAQILFIFTVHARKGTKLGDQIFFMAIVFHVSYNPLVVVRVKPRVLELERCTAKGIDLKTIMDMVPSDLREQDIEDVGGDNAALAMGDKYHFIDIDRIFKVFGYYRFCDTSFACLPVDISLKHALYEVAQQTVSPVIDTQNWSVESLGNHLQLLAKGSLSHGNTIDKDPTISGVEVLRRIVGIDLQGWALNQSPDQEGVDMRKELHDGDADYADSYQRKHGRSLDQRPDGEPDDTLSVWRTKVELIVLLCSEERSEQIR